MSVTFRSERMLGRHVPHPHDEFCDPNCPGDWEEPGMNVGQQNARALLFALDLDTEDLAGEAEPYDLKARCALALARGLNQAEPVTTVAGDGHATMIHMGRDGYYVPRRLLELMKVCDEAKARGELVVWS